MNKLFEVYDVYPFDLPNESTDLALDNLQMAFTEILRLRKEGKDYDTYKLIKFGAEFGRALMLYIDEADEEIRNNAGPTTDPYDAMRDMEDMAKEIELRR